MAETFEGSELIQAKYNAFGHTKKGFSRRLDSCVSDTSQPWEIPPQGSLFMSHQWCALFALGAQLVPLLAEPLKGFSISTCLYRLFQLPSQDALLDDDVVSSHIMPRKI